MEVLFELTLLILEFIWKSILRDEEYHPLCIEQNHGFMFSVRLSGSGRSPVSYANDKLPTGRAMSRTGTPAGIIQTLSMGVSWRFGCFFARQLSFS
jgi:hypothetical protein